MNNNISLYSFSKYFLFKNCRISTISIVNELKSKENNLESIIYVAVCERANNRFPFSLILISSVAEEDKETQSLYMQNNLQRETFKGNKCEK